MAEGFHNSERQRHQQHQAVGKFTQCGAARTGGTRYTRLRVKPRQEARNPNARVENGKEVRTARDPESAVIQHHFKVDGAE